MELKIFKLPDMKSIVVIQVDSKGRWKAVC